jgi:hypothetical protein
LGGHQSYKPKLEFYDTREFRDMAAPFEATLQLLGIRKLGVRPENIESFNQGDGMTQPNDSRP